MHEDQGPETLDLHGLRPLVGGRSPDASPAPARPSPSARTPRSERAPGARRAAPGATTLPITADAVAQAIQVPDLEPRARRVNSVLRKAIDNGAFTPNHLVQIQIVTRKQPTPQERQVIAAFLADPDNAHLLSDKARHRVGAFLAASADQAAADASAPPRPHARRSPSRLVSVGQFKFNCLGDGSLKVNYPSGEAQIALSLDRQGNALKLPLDRVFDLEDCCALLVALGSKGVPIAHRELVYEYLAFAFQAFNPRSLSVVLGHIRGHGQALPAGLVAAIRVVLGKLDDEAAALLDQLAPAFGFG